MVDAAVVESTGLCTEAKGDCGGPGALPYFISFMIIGCFVVLNLVVAVILDNFSSLGKVRSDLVSAGDIDTFKEAWTLFDPDADQKIPAADLPNLVLSVAPPLGLMGVGDRTRALRLCIGLEVRAPGGGTRKLRCDVNGEVGFVEVLDALIRRSYKAVDAELPEDDDTEDLPTETAEKSQELSEGHAGTSLRDAARIFALETIAVRVRAWRDRMSCLPPRVRTARRQRSAQAGQRAVESPSPAPAEWHHDARTADAEQPTEPEWYVAHTPRSGTPYYHRWEVRWEPPEPNSSGRDEVPKDAAAAALVAEQTALVAEQTALVTEQADGDGDIRRELQRIAAMQERILAIVTNPSSPELVQSPPRRAHGSGSCTSHGKDVRALQASPLVASTPSAEHGSSLPLQPLAKRLQHQFDVESSTSTPPTPPSATRGVTDDHTSHDVKAVPSISGARMSQAPHDPHLEHTPSSPPALVLPYAARLPSPSSLASQPPDAPASGMGLGASYASAVWNGGTTASPGTEMGNDEWYEAHTPRGGTKYYHSSAGQVQWQAPTPPSSPIGHAIAVAAQQQAELDAQWHLWRYGLEDKQVELSDSPSRSAEGSHSYQHI